jgi:hypothetical protein
VAEFSWWLVSGWSGARGSRFGLKQRDLVVVKTRAKISEFFRNFLANRKLHIRNDASARENFLANCKLHFLILVARFETKFAFYARENFLAPSLKNELRAAKKSKSGN